MLNRAEALRIAGEGNPLAQGQPGEQHEYVLHLEATAMVRAEMPRGEAEVDDAGLATFPGYVGQMQLGRAFEAATQQLAITRVEHGETCPCRTKGERTSEASAMQTQGREMREAQRASEIKPVRAGGASEPEKR